MAFSIYPASIITDFDEIRFRILRIKVDGQFQLSAALIHNKT
jgi:hypothetical protein